MVHTASESALVAASIFAPTRASCNRWQRPWVKTYLLWDLDAGAVCSKRKRSVLLGEPVFTDKLPANQVDPQNP